MKDLKFDANLGFQLEAIQAITDIFDGQKVCQSNFTVRKTEIEENLKEKPQGYANELQLIDEELVENIHAVQLRKRAGAVKRCAGQDEELQHLDGDRHGQDLCLSADDFRIEQALWLHQIHHRGSVACHQGRREVFS